LIERISDILGWIGGVATVYGPVSLGAAGTVWAASWLVRFAGRMISLVAA